VLHGEPDLAEGLLPSGFGCGFHGSPTPLNHE